MRSQHCSESHRVTRLQHKQKKSNINIENGGIAMTVKSQNEKLGQGVGFERIRRITGYLVGTMDKWNDAKRAEERDRVKHGMGRNA